MNSFLYLSLCLSALFASVLSLSCMRCEDVTCKTPTCPKGVGLVKDVCGCCDACAKTEKQKCGGPWGLAGLCDKGLSCVVRKNGKVVHDRGINLFPGKCEPNACRQKKCNIHQTCTVINQKPVCECPRHCKNTGKPVCGLTNGFQYANECQLRKYECKLGKKIGVKQGPCKRCSMAGKPYKFGEQIKKGQCESCTCFHGSWVCTNVCAPPAPPEPILAPEGARCDINGEQTVCGPGMVCQPNPNQSKGNVFGICTVKKNEELTVPIPESLPSPPPLPCPVRKCNRCKYGYIVDENGCKTCECKSKKSDCSLPKQAGPCLAYIPRFYFNSKVGKCMTFIYGGCNPNANNFKSRKACERKCLV